MGGEGGKGMGDGQGKAWERRGGKEKTKARSMDEGQGRNMKEEWRERKSYGRQYGRRAEKRKEVAGEGVTRGGGGDGYGDVLLSYTLPTAMTTAIGYTTVILTAILFPAKHRKMQGTKMPESRPVKNTCLGATTTTATRTSHTEPPWPTFNTYNHTYEKARAAPQSPPSAATSRSVTRLQWREAPKQTLDTTIPKILLHEYSDNK